MKKQMKDKMKNKYKTKTLSITLLFCLVIFSNQSLAFFEDFEDMDASKFTDFLGSWSITTPGAQGSLYSYLGTGGNPQTLFPMLHGYGRIELDFNIHNGSVGDFNIFFQVSEIPTSGYEPNEGYLIAVFPTGSDSAASGETISLRRFDVDGSNPILASVNPLINANTFHHIRIDRLKNGEENLIEVYLDNATEPIISVEDSTYLDLGSIYCGFVSSTGQLDNIKVTGKKRKLK